MRRRAARSRPISAVSIEILGQIRNRERGGGADEADDENQRQPPPVRRQVGKGPAELGIRTASIVRGARECQTSDGSPGYDRVVRPVSGAARRPA